MNLIIGGVEVPQLAGLDLSQSYAPVDGGSAVVRTLNGSAVKMTSWTKLRTEITGGGWVPPGLESLDYSAAIVLDCIAPRVIFSASNVATLPTVRRPDATPYVFALTSDGRHVSTDVVVVADTATAVPVAGAVRYLFHYYPRLTVFASLPRESFDSATGSATWAFDAEEV